MSPLLAVEGLSKRFSGLVANQDISFDIEAGSIAGLIGPNGAGKTTLFNCLAGFHQPSAGRILLDGTDITGKSADAVARSGIARTFQIVRIFQEMSVEENVMVGAMMHHKGVAAARQAAQQQLEFVGLAHRAHISAGSLTVSEQKRLEVARALAIHPRLILLDEIMAGLNQTEVREASALVRRIAGNGIACIVVEHVMEGIMPIADRILVLDYGIKIADDHPSEIAKNPAVIQAYLGE